MLAMLCVADLKSDTPEKLAPLAGACHFSPVLSELSATILQEQSQRIVLRGLKPLNPQRLIQGLQV